MRNDMMQVSVEGREVLLRIPVEIVTRLESESLMRGTVPRYYLTTFGSSGRIEISRDAYEALWHAMKARRSAEAGRP